MRKLFQPAQGRGTEPRQRTNTRVPTCRRCRRLLLLLLRSCSSQLHGIAVAPCVIFPHVGGGITWGCGGTGAKKTFPGAVRWRDIRENAEGDGCSCVNAAAAAGVVDFLFFVLFCFVYGQQQCSSTSLSARGSACCMQDHLHPA